MQEYKNLTRKSGVAAYEIGDDYIDIQYKNGNIYKYTYDSPGKNEVEALKLFAKEGKGLNSYINKTLLNKYAEMIPAITKNITENLDEIDSKINYLINKNDIVIKDDLTIFLDMKKWILTNKNNRIAFDKKVYVLTENILKIFNEQRNFINNYDDMNVVKEKLKNIFCELKNQVKNNIDLHNSRIKLEDEDKKLSQNEQIKKLNTDLTKREEELKSYVEEFKRKYDNRIEYMNQQTNDYLDFINDHRINILNVQSDVDKQIESINNTHIEFKNKIEIELKNLLSNIQNEQLAYHFQYEGCKLKGDLNLFIIFVSTILTLTCFNIIDLYNDMLFAGNFCARLICTACIFILFTLIIEYILRYKKKTIKVGMTVTNLFTPFWCWLFGTFSGLIAIFYFANSLYNSQPYGDWHHMLMRLPLFTVLIWFTWFCAKQFSYIKQICDEYEYKYALSKSYLSYRDEANKLAFSAGKEILLASLLDAVIKNIATSPVQSVKSDCHTPFTEALKAFEHLPSGIKKGDIKSNF